MPLSPHVFDANRANFNDLVLGNSHKGLVLVHFWTPKAGPCMLLMPRLVQLAADFGGRFLLVMANTEEAISRRALLTLFNMLGAEHEFTRRYRARLAGRE